VIEGDHNSSQSMFPTVCTWHMLLSNSDGSETYLQHLGLPVAVYSLSSDLTRVYLKWKTSCYVDVSVYPYVTYRLYIVYTSQVLPASHDLHRTHFVV
jgi:hypothetical protein